ncbi:serine/threonine-protein kinase [Nocardioides sp. LHD-245]|uniref:serine/threonine-protein kinase n=1 Tax=Nocardioides sp. LHD-245 TaxID=3051387 RepID=UPI0027DF7198|nr:serine/threonine-protein kinase [Nocardioides sp. LHD-245]
MALHPGDSFGRYDVTGQLGRGGMGVVLAAVHRDLDRPVALKVLAPHLVDDAAYRARFLREAKALARLDSPYVVRVFDAGEEDGALFIATELVPGGDLNRLLRDDGPLFLPDAVALVRDLAVGLGTAHEVGILHRDIKPSNVLVGELADGRIRPVLCDFGIAAVADLEQLATTGAVGTPGYMAPERHQGVDATVASDIYALGCVLWAALTARAPYEGATGQVLLGHLQGPVPQLPASSADAVAVNEVLATAMAKDPAARFGTTAELVAALDAIPLDDPEPTLVDIGPPTRPRPVAAPSARRRRWIPLLIGLVVALALGAGAIAWALDRSGPAPSARGGDPSAGVVAPATDALLAVFPRAAECEVVSDPKSARVQARWCLDATSSVYYAQWRGWDAMDANYRDRTERDYAYRSDLRSAWVELAEVDREHCRRKLALWYDDRAAPYSVTVCADSEQAVRDVLDDLDLPPGDEVASRDAPAPDALVAAFPGAADCTEVVEPRPTRVRARWCHDQESSVHYTQWTTWQAMDANYRDRVVRDYPYRSGLHAAWVELTKADGKQWKSKLAVWYDDRAAPYSITIYADDEQAVRDVLEDLDLPPGDDVAAVPRG